MVVCSSYSNFKMKVYTVFALLILVAVVTASDLSLVSEDKVKDPSQVLK